MKIIEVVRSGKEGQGCKLLKAKIIQSRLVPFRSKSGSFLSMTMSDDSGVIDAKIWDDAEELFEKLKVGSYVSDIKAQINLYKGSRSLIIRSFGEILEPEPRVKIEEIKRSAESLVEKANTIEEPGLKRLALEVLRLERFRRCPAAPVACGAHDDMMGGLIRHTESVLRIALEIAENCKFIDRDLLTAGAVVHDVGKINVYSKDFKVKIGRLTDHSVEGVLIVQKIIDENGIKFEEKDTRDKIFHMIMSHHYGFSENPPITLECMVLALADIADADAQTFDQEIFKLEFDKDGTAYSRSVGRKIKK